MRMYLCSRLPVVSEPHPDPLYLAILITTAMQLNLKGPKVIYFVRKEERLLREHQLEVRPFSPKTIRELGGGGTGGFELPTSRTVHSRSPPPSVAVPAPV